MKKLLLFSLILIGCSKEDELEAPTTPCNCGTIVNDGANGCYWLEIENDCTGNIKKFCFSESIWMSAYVGTDFCVTNQGQW